MINSLIEYLTATSAHGFVTSNTWVWPVMEMVHFLGLCLLFGSLLLVDLRVLGVARNVPLKFVDKFILLTLIGFTLNAVTGVLFLIGDPGRYLINIAFKVKMILICLAGCNAIFFTLKVRPKIHAGVEAANLPGYTKPVALASLLFWTSIIVLGRLIPYVEDM